MATYTDSFTDTDATNLETHNSNWVLVDGSAGDWKIYSNEARNINAADFSAYYYNQAFNSKHYSQLENAGSTNIAYGAGPAIRVQAGANYFYCFIFDSAVYNGEVINGSATDWDGGQAAPNESDVMRIEVDATTETTILYKVNGATIQTYTGKSNLSGGRAGVASYDAGNSANQVDN